MTLVSLGWAAVHRSGQHGGRLDCREGLSTPGSAAAVGAWSDGGCVALCGQGEERVALSCYKRWVVTLSPAAEQLL
jgi:hypothetical protein